MSAAKPTLRTARVLFAVLVLAVSLNGTEQLNGAPATEDSLRQALEQKKKEQARLEAERSRLEAELRRSAEQRERVKVGGALYRESQRKSFYFPGWGQWDRGRHETGAAFGAGFTYLVYRSYTSYVHYKSATADYSDLGLPVLIIAGIREPVALGWVAAVFDERRRNVAERRAALNLFALFTVGVYGWNIYDMQRNNPYLPRTAGFSLDVATGKGAGSGPGGKIPMHIALGWTMNVR